jgi:acetyl esterase/lipase
MPTHPDSPSRLGIPDADTAHVARKTFDLPYATLSEAQTLDIYYPATQGPFPVILWIHGGAFMGGDKRDQQLEPALKGLERGYAVVSMNYRMSGEATFPALVHDVKTAVRWVRSNAAAHGFDPTRIAVWGGSAGGYLALMAGVAGALPEFDDPVLGNTEQSAEVQAAVAWFPPADFMTMDAQLEASGFVQTPESAHSGPQSPESLILGRQITLIPDLVRRADPAAYIRPGLPPFFIQHGSADEIVPYQQSLVFAGKLATVNGAQTVRYELLLNARHGHEDPAFKSQANVDKILDFLDQTMHVSHVRG